MGRTNGVHRIGNRALALAAVGLVLTALSAPADAGAQEPGRGQGRVRAASIDTTFAVGSGASLEIRMPHIGRGSADVQVIGWSEGRIRVEGETSDGELSITVSGSSVDIGTRSSQGMTRVEELRVHVPHGTRVLVSNGNGDVTLTGTRGPVEATSFNGDVSVTDAAERLEIRTFNGDATASGITGRVSVNASNGDVLLRDIRGEIAINTLNGDVELDAITSRSVRAKTMSGRLAYNGTVDRDGEYSFNAFSGEIDMAIPADAGATLSVSTFSGSIESPDFPLTLKPGARSRESKGQSMTFDIGNGGARISLESFSGSITIREQGAARREP